MEGRLLTVAEVADYLGISRAGVYRAIENDGLPFIRISPRRMRFRREDVDAWLDGRTRIGAAS